MNRTIFDAAKQNKFLLVLKYLKEYENNPNERDENGLTCLHICATYGHLETAKVLVSNGADLQMKDFISGWTALHRAIYFQHIQLTLFLIHVGARLDLQSFQFDNLRLDNSSSLRDQEGLTPLDLLSLQLRKNLRLFPNNPASQGVIMSFGKADFTLGVPLPKSSDISRPKRLDLLILESIIDVSAAKYHALAVTKEGTVYSWGNGRSGKLGNGTENSHPEPVLITSLLKQRVTKIAASENHSLVLTDRGQVFAFGSDRFGQLGLGNTDTNRWTSEPKRIDGLKREMVVGIAAGDHHSLCYTSDGKVFGWGSNKNGQLGINPSELSSAASGVNSSPVPRKVSLPFTTANSRTRYSSTSSASIMQVVAAYQSSLLLCRTTNNSSGMNSLSYMDESSWRNTNSTEVYQWGDGVSMIRRIYFNNRYYTKRTRSHEYASEEHFMDSFLKHDKAMDPTNIIQVAAGKYHFAGLSSMGFVYTWGLGSDQLGHYQSGEGGNSSNDSKYTSTPQIVEALLPENGGGKVVSISLSGNRSCAVTELGDLYTWGATNDKGVLSASSAVNYLPVPKKVYGIKRAVRVSAGEDYTLVLLSCTVPNVVSHPSSSEITSSAVVLHQADEEEEFVHSTSAAGDGADAFFLNSPSVQESTPSSLFPEEGAFNGKEIPSLQTMCQQVLCQSINLKNILSALSFSERISARSLFSYCLQFIANNFDAILVQAKPTEIEKFLDETMDLQNILKRRKESFSETREESSSSFSYRKDSMERKYSYEFKSSTSVPTSAPLVEKRDYQDVNNSQDMMKLIRAVKKKIQSIEQIEEKIKLEGYQPSKEQLEKLSKKSELQSELAKLEQYLVRLLNREKAAEIKSQPIEEKANSSESLQKKEEVKEKKKEKSSKSSEPQKDSLPSDPSPSDVPSPSATSTAPAAISEKKSKKKTKFVPFDLSSPLPVSPVPSTPVKTNNPAPSTAAPVSFAQWSNMFATPAEVSSPPPAAPSAQSKLSEVDFPSSTTAPNNTSAKRSVSISSSFNGRTVLSPPEKVTPPQISLPAAAAGAEKSSFALLDFMTPSKKQAGLSASPSPSTNAGTSTAISSSSAKQTPPLSRGAIAKQLAAELSPAPKNLPASLPPAVSAWGKTANQSPGTSVKMNTPTSATATTSKPAGSVVTSSASPSPRVSLMEIQREEEFIRQHSDLPTLKGNEIPWKIERQMRSDSLNKVIEQERIAKENEEILREVAAFEERERKAKQQQEQAQRQQDKKKGRGGGAGGNSSEKKKKPVAGPAAK